MLQENLLDIKVTIIPNKQTPYTYVDAIPLFCTSLASVTGGATKLVLELSVKEKTIILGGGHGWNMKAEDTVNTMMSLDDLTGAAGCGRSQADVCG